MLLVPTTDGTRVGSSKRGGGGGDLSVDDVIENNFARLDDITALVDSVRGGDKGTPLSPPPSAQGRVLTPPCATRCAGAVGSVRPRVVHAFVLWWGEGGGGIRQHVCGCVSPAVSAVPHPFAAFASARHCCVLLAQGWMALGGGGVVLAALLPAAPPPVSPVPWLSHHVCAGSPQAMLDIDQMTTAVLPALVVHTKQLLGVFKTIDRMEVRVLLGWAERAVPSAPLGSCWEGAAAPASPLGVVAAVWARCAGVCAAGARLHASVCTACRRIISGAQGAEPQGGGSHDAVADLCQGRCNAAAMAGAGSPLRWLHASMCTHHGSMWLVWVWVCVCVGGGGVPGVGCCVLRVACRPGGCKCRRQPRCSPRSGTRSRCFSTPPRCSRHYGSSQGLPWTPPPFTAAAHHGPTAPLLKNSGRSVAASVTPHCAPLPPVRPPVIAWPADRPAGVMPITGQWWWCWWFVKRGGGERT
jgi:hypothetical protein